MFTLTTWDDKFPEPKTIEEAKARKKGIAEDVQAIQAQLGTTRRTHDDGTEYDYIEYAEWKRKAKFALKMKYAHGRLLKDWITKNHPQTRWAARPIEERLQKRIPGQAFRFLIEDCMDGTVLPAASEDELATRYLNMAREYLESKEGGTDGRNGNG